MERCCDWWQCEGGELIAATVVPEPAVSERISIAGWLGDDECECECSGTETKCKFQFSRFRRNEFEAIDRRGQLDAATTIKFWKCTWRRRRKWLGQLPTTGCCSCQVHGADACVHDARHSKCRNDQLARPLHSESVESEPRQPRHWQRRRRLSEPG